MTSVSIWKPSAPVPVRARPPKPERAAVMPPEFEVLRSALAAIPNTGSTSLDYDKWFGIACAVHYATEGSDAGLELFREWSAKSQKHEDEFLDSRVWPYIQTERGGEVITERSLFALAAQHGWQDPTIVDDFDVVEAPPEDDFQALPPAVAKPLRFAPIPAAEFAVATQLRWIIKGVLPHAELAVLYGESGSGKSFMALDLAAAVALGVDWRGRKTHRGKVVYVAAEGANGFRNRLRAYAQQHQIDLKDLDVHVIHAAPNMLDKADALDVARAILKVVGRPDLIIIDTLAQTMPGGNENAGEDMGRALAHCRGLHTATGALVMLVHHSGKDSSRGARGWSGLRAAADVEMEVSRSDEDRVLAVTKQKDGDDGEAFGFKLETVLIDFDIDGDEVTSCVVAHCDTAVGSQKARNAPKGKNEITVHKIVLDLLDVGEAPTVDEVLSEYANRTPFDPQQGRDTRRQHAMRALRSLIDKGSFRASGVRVELPDNEGENT